MSLAIATNPNTKKPQELWRTLDQQLRQNEGKEYIDAEFDPVAFERFKQTLQRNSSGIIVK